MKTKLLLAFCFLLAIAARAQSWDHVGPFSQPGSTFESGRLDCIMLDPGFNGVRNQKIYAGSISAGLWKTSDLGQNWTNIAIPNSVLYHGISALEYSPAGFALAATCNSIGVPVTGGTIYQVDLAANTWTPTFLTDVVLTPYVNDIAVFPNDASVVFAATKQGLFRSGDYGMNWTLVLEGHFEKVDFMELQAAQGGYRVFVCGEGDIEYSTDKGLNFSPHTVLINMFPAGFYADMSATYDPADPGKQYLYVVAVNLDANEYGTDRVVRMQHHITGGFEVFVQSAAILETHPASKGRMCAAAYDQAVYFGCNGSAKWLVNGSSGTFYTIQNSVDMPITLQIPYGGTYPVHADNHEMKLVPSLNLLLLVTDGGFGHNFYTPQSNGVNLNSWTKANNGLHISQIWGLGISDQDTTKFFTGEQDTKAFLSTVNSSTSSLALSNEPSNVIMDKFNSGTYFYRGPYSTQGIYNGANMTPIPHSDHWDATGASFCNTNSSMNFPEPEYGFNTFFQDPNRPGHIFHGEKGPSLTEICFSGSKNIVKASFAGTWNQYVNGMAFTKADKNKVFVSISNRIPPGEGKAKVFMYTGSDFDDSWLGHNVTWTDITPANNNPVFNPALNASNEYLMESAGIAASDWDTGRIWWAVRKVPGNPNLKVLKRSGGVWSDYSQGIPAGEFPVSLVYEQGTNEQLYLGTNVNMYYRNATMSSWQLFSGTLANICMQQLRINYADNTLRLGTYGHGVWMTDLVCPPDFFLVESGNTVADKFAEAAGFILGSGIISWGDVKYRAGEYIELQPGFLVSSGSTTRFDAFIHGCAMKGNTFREAQSGDDYELLEMMSKGELNGGKKEPQMQIVPNPGAGIFYLQRESADEARIMVYDLNGRCILDRQNVSAQREAIDLSENPNGLYLVRVLSGERVESFRIVKQ